MCGSDMEPNLKYDEREGDALKQMCGSEKVEHWFRDTPDAYNHRDNRINRYVLPKGSAQEGHERSDDIESIQCATLDECEYD